MSALILLSTWTYKQKENCSRCVDVHARETNVNFKKPHATATKGLPEFPQPWFCSQCWEERGRVAADFHPIFSSTWRWVLKPTPRLGTGTVQVNNIQRPLRCKAAPKPRWVSAGFFLRDATTLDNCWLREFRYAAQEARSLENCFKARVK